MYNHLYFPKALPSDKWRLGQNYKFYCLVCTVSRSLLLLPPINFGAVTEGVTENFHQSKHSYYHIVLYINALQVVQCS